MLRLHHAAVGAARRGAQPHGTSVQWTGVTRACAASSTVAAPLLRVASHQQPRCLRAQATGCAAAAASCSRPLSTAATATGSYVTGKDKTSPAAATASASSPYSHTMLLPRTSFPLHVPGIAAHERALAASHCGPRLYDWQSVARASLPRERTFILHDGPPFANGKLHMGHFLNKVLKDICNRYKLLRGFRIHYVPGWDCHGMPIEVKALEQLRASSSPSSSSSSSSSSATSVSASAASASADGATLSAGEVRSLASRFALAAMQEQKSAFMRWGLLGAWDTPYATMDPRYESAQLGVFATLVRKGLVYRGLKPVYWSPVSRTALAEAELEYYVDNHVSTSLYVGFPVTSLGAAASNVSAESPTPAALSLDRFPGLRALLWTTTPWTLPANQAIAFHPELEYAVVRVGAVDTVLVKAAEAEEKEAKAKETKGQPKPKDATPEEGAGIEGAYLLVCTARLETLRSLLRRDIVVESTFPGSALEGAVAAHPFLSGRVSPFIPGSHVASDAGTGLVHTAPAHGAEDFAACRAAGINEVHCPVSANGDYDAALVGHPQLVGHNVLKGASKTVVAILRANGGLVHTSRLVHRFPYDWRSKTPVIQRATEQWFCRLDALAPQAQRALQQQVRLVPEQGAQRLHSMIASRKEWCISRQRHWGVPIPVFYPNDGGEPLLTPESVAHVAALVRQHGTDCWWSLPIEDLLPPSHRAQAAKYTRGSDTMDVWFDSGCSWRAVVQDDVLGFKAPAEQATAAVADGNVEPVVADMYLEGSDQHRGWFQSSLLTAVAAMDRAPYKTILTHGFVLDEQMRKMSKSLGNVLDPNVLINGAAAAATAGESDASTAANSGVAVDKKAKGGAKAKKGGGGGGSSDGPLGVDLLRLWVASSDCGGDVSIGKTVLGKTGEAARKLRQSARFMIGCIDELPAARVAPYASLGALDRYTLGLVSAHARTVTDAYEQLDFKGVFALSVSFNAVQLSAFLFDHAKDRLYADKADSDARRNVQTVLLHALVVFTKSLAPIAPHFAEEIYQHVPLQLRPLFRDESINDGTATPAAAEQEAEDSLFMHGWLSSACSPAWVDDELAASVESARRVRSHVTKLLERVRQGQCQSASAAQQGNVKLGSFSEAEVTLELAGSSTLYRDLAERLGSQELNTLLTTARTHIVALAEPLPVPEAGSAADSASSSSSSADGGAGASFEELVSEAGSDGQLTGLRIRFAPAKGSKCPRCRLFTEDATEEEPCCARCRAVLQELATAQ